MDLTSPNLMEEAKSLGLYSEDMGPFDFKTTFCSQSSSAHDMANSTCFRFRHGRELMEKAASTGNISFSKHTNCKIKINWQLAVYKNVIKIFLNI